MKCQMQTTPDAYHPDRAAHAHIWVHKASYETNYLVNTFTVAPIVGPLSRQMHPGETYCCTRCQLTITIPTHKERTA